MTSQSIANYNSNLPQFLLRMMMLQRVGEHWENMSSPKNEFKERVRLVSSWVWAGRVSVHYLRLTSTCHTTRPTLIPPLSPQAQSIGIEEKKPEQYFISLDGRFISLSPVTNSFPFFWNKNHQQMVLKQPQYLVLKVAGVFISENWQMNCKLQVLSCPYLL